MFGGQFQHGIVTPKKYNVILLFVGGKGKERGYYNHYDTEERYHMYGEERAGKYEYNYGNAAVRDHIVNNKTLHLFESVEDGMVEYCGQQMLIRDYRNDKDSSGRNPIIFVLEDITTIPAQYTNEVKRNISRQLMNYSSSIEQKTYMTKEERKKRNEEIIKKLKIYYDFRCQICGWTSPKRRGGYYIEAAHIVPKAEDGDENPENLLILCPNHHKMFDTGDTSFTIEDGRVKNLMINDEQLTVNYTDWVV